MSSAVLNFSFFDSSPSSLLLSSSACLRNHSISRVSADTLFVATVFS